MPRKSTRRDFLKTSAALGSAFWVTGSLQAKPSKSPNEKLNIAAIGAGGKGRTDIRMCAETENIVALCDVDEQRAAETYEKYPSIERFTDFRVMLDKKPEIDAVIVTTPDHTHAVAAIRAMKMGKHVYCQKPLTHDIYEARRMREVAAETGVATQMGNQGHSLDGTRSIVELVRGGVIGNVHEVHVWTDRPGKYWKQPLERPTDTPPVPSTLDWDLWLGPVAERPYSPLYVPHDWRAWWDFGTGAMGDMGCHLADTAYWALELDAPVSVEAQSSGPSPESPPAWEIIKYEFGARKDGKLPPVTFYWYDGGKKPPQELGDGKPLPGNGNLIIGEKGTVFTQDEYSSTYRLLPEDKFVNVKLPEPWLPRTGNNPYQEWIKSCKGGAKAESNFCYSGRLTEFILLGNLAVRLGKKIEWDAAGLKCVGIPEADKLIRRETRKGWELG